MSAIEIAALPVPAAPWHAVPGARSFGPSVARRRSRPFDLKRALAALGVASLADWRNLPMVGDERGDRSELERVMVGSFALGIGQPTIITREFPVGDPWLAMSLNLRGQLNNGVGPTGTVVADAPLPLWRLALTTDLDKDIIEPSVQARALYRYSHLMYGTAGDLVAPVLTASTVTDFNVGVVIPFADPMLNVPQDTVLDTRRYNSLVLTIDSGILTDIVTSPANVTLQNLFVDIEVLRISPRMAAPLNLVKALAHYKRYAPIVPAGETFVNLDRVPTLAIKRLAWFAAGGTQVVAGVPFTGAGNDGIIDTLRVSSNLRDHFGSPSGGVSRRVLRNANKLDYSIETWPTGWYVYDTMLDRSIKSALATGDKSILQSLHTYQSGLPGTPAVSILQASIQKLRGTRGR